MNYAKSTFLLLATSLLFACNSSETNTTTQKASIEKEVEEPIFTPTDFHLKSLDEDCENPEECTHVVIDFSYPKDISEAEFAVVSDYFMKLTRNSFQAYSDSSMQDLQSLADVFVMEFKQFKNEDSGDFNTAPWYYEMKGNFNFQNEEWISLELNEYSYTGGAHGNYQTIIKTFNKADLKELTFEDLTISEISLAKKMEQALRSQYGLSPEDDLGAAGFWFEDNTFQLNSNYAIRNDSLIFLYNPYEISSYAAGIIEIGVPLSQLGEVL